KFENLIDSHKFGRVSSELKKHHTPTIANVLHELRPAHQVILFRLLPKDRASAVFRRMEAHQEEQLLKHLTHDETILLMKSLKPDDRVNLMEEMPPAVTRRLLNMLEPEDRAEAVELLGYPED